MLSIKSLVIIIPAYQPSEKWDELLMKRLEGFLSLLPTELNSQVIIVDDGSFPPIGQISDKVKLLRYSVNMGKGYAIRYALERVSADIYMYTDVDIPYKPECMLNIVHEVLNGADISIARRENDYNTQIGFLRKSLSYTLKWIIRHIVGLENEDTQGGLKAMNEHGKKILLKTKINRYLFDLEWIKLAEKNRLKIASIPVSLHQGITQKPMGLNILIKEVCNLFKLIF